MTTHHLQRYSVIVLVLLLGSALTTHASDHGIAGNDQPALEGFSPVSYYEQGHPETGSRKYQSTYQGNVYWFTSAKQKKTFDADPSAYLITHVNQLLSQLRATLESYEQSRR